jgi:hypothetical protein
VNQFCPRCGALFAPDVNLEFSRTKLLCIECGLALDEPPQVLPPSEVDDDQVAYELLEWPAEDRAIASADLVELGIPYRWEDNLVLVVPATAEAEVDAILDEIDENAATEGETLIDLDLAPGDGEDGGEEATTAMSDLFIAVDGLQHAVFDEARVAEFMTAAAAVEQSLPPYGIDALLWRRVQSEASAIVAALEKDSGEDDDAVLAAIRALRNLLRQYV